MDLARRRCAVIAKYRRQICGPPDGPLISRRFWRNSIGNHPERIRFCSLARPSRACMINETHQLEAIIQKHLTLHKTTTWRAQLMGASLARSLSHSFLYQLLPSRPRPLGAPHWPPYGDPAWRSAERRRDQLITDLGTGRAHIPSSQVAALCLSRPLAGPDSGAAESLYRARLSPGCLRCS